MKKSYKLKANREGNIRENHIMKEKMSEETINIKLETRERETGDFWEIMRLRNQKYKIKDTI